ncbi:MAG TPA: hypothetical protein VIA45_04725 [Thermoanaerobaculia bacterium]|jgi:hypothetical protein
MKMHSTVLRAALLGIGLAALALPLSAQITIHKYVALGDSYGAGYGAGCLVTREQAFSYPRQLATAFGVTDFQQPTISDPGIPTCIGVTNLIPVTFAPISDHTGVPTNLGLARPYDNLSVPGFKAADVTDTTSGGLADAILRGLGSARDQALVLNPDFITLGIIGNDILTAGGAGFLMDGVTATPLPVFQAKYNALAASLAASGRNGVFIGTPNPLFIPLASTVPPVVVDANNQPVLDPNGDLIPLLGPGNTAYPCPGGAPACPLPAGTRVTLGAIAPMAALGGKSLLQVGFGVPCAVAPLPMCDHPLPDGSFTPPATVNVGVLLYPDEVAAIDQRVQDMNAVISSAAAANGFKYFDFYALSNDLIANGRTYGGLHVTKDFVTGGMFAYGEAVHMSNIGYTILADELIQFINSSYGSSFPRPDINTALTTPDLPASGAAATISMAGAQPVLFGEEAWRRVLQMAPLANATALAVFPGDGSLPEREPIRTAAPRGRGGPGH